MPLRPNHISFKSTECKESDLSVCKYFSLEHLTIGKSEKVKY